MTNETFDSQVNFGDVRIPRGFDYPKPQKLAALNGVHGVSSEPIVVVDAQTLLIPSFSYDGEAPGKREKEKSIHNSFEKLYNKCYLHTL